MMKTLLISLLLICVTSSAVQWGDYLDGELHWGETLHLDDYVLIVADFTPEESQPWMVMLNLYQDGELIACRAMEKGNSFDVDDRVKVSVEDIKIRDYSLDEGIEPSAKVRIEIRALPELAIRLSADDDSYDAEQYIELELNVENVGEIDADNIDIVLTSTPPLVYEKYSKSSLEPGESWDEKQNTKAIDPIKLRVKVPYLPGPEKFEVTAHATYRDSEDEVVQSKAGTMFDIFGPIKLNKYVKEDQNFGEINYVRLSLRNTGNKTLKIKLTDSTGRYFKTSSPLKWILEILPDEMEVINYQIEAKEPGENQALPSAEASYELNGYSYAVFSESPVVDVIGPFVKATKKASSTSVDVGENIGITVDVSNTGNRRTKVSVEEIVPPWAGFIDGNTELSQVLLPGETTTLEYNISCGTAGRFEIPPSKICYRYYDGTACMLDSSRLKITVNDEDPELNDESNIDQIYQTPQNQDDSSEDRSPDEYNAESITETHTAKEKTQESPTLLLGILSIIALLFMLFRLM